MKITKRQLRRIIKEERSRLLNEDWGATSVGTNAEQPPRASQSSGAHMSGRNNDVMSQLHTAIDALIGALGDEEARQELLGIVEEWEREEVREDASPKDNEGTSLKAMPSAWQQILDADPGYPK